MNVLGESAERSTKTHNSFSHIFDGKEFAGLKSFGDFDQNHRARLKNDQSYIISSSSQSPVSDNIGFKQHISVPVS